MEVGDHTLDHPVVIARSDDDSRRSGQGVKTARIQIFHQSAERLAQLEQAVRRSCAACYAAEGVYPPDLAYLQERYGLQIDEERYLVHYSATAQNLMPDITVLPLE